MTTPATPRKTPCSSCPYREDVPSGVWSREEYEKLRNYDGTTTDQAQAGAVTALFCHQADGQVCAGWAGCHDMDESLAARVGAAMGTIDVTITSYRTSVPLFTSGAEAADHGERDIGHPSQEARDTIAKVVATRDLRGQPVHFTPEDTP